MNNKILVTGSSGFLGEEIVNNLSAKNQIFALDKDQSISFEKNSSNIQVILCDIRNKSELEKVFSSNNIDTLIHCAAEILDEKDSNEVWNTNYNGTKNLLDLCEKFKVEIERRSG